MGPFRPAGTPRAPLAPAPGAGRPSRVPGAGVGRLRGSRAAAGARAAGKTSKMGQIRRTVFGLPRDARDRAVQRESLFFGVVGALLGYNYEKREALAPTDEFFLS